MRKQQRKIKSKPLLRKHRRIIAIRKKIIGSAERPRVCLVKTNKHISVQVIDDEQGKTLFSVGTYGKNVPEGVSNNKGGAKKIGLFVADALKEKNIKTVLFDRRGNKYTGKIASFVDAIRESGIRV